MRRTLKLFGTDGRPLFDLTSGAWVLESPWLLPDGEHDAWRRIEAKIPEGFDPAGAAALDEYWFVDEFADALDAGREHASVVEATYALEIILGAFESAAYGRAVSLPQADRGHRCSGGAGRVSRARPRPPLGAGAGMMCRAGRLSAARARQAAWSTADRCRGHHRARGPAKADRCRPPACPSAHQSPPDLGPRRVYLAPPAWPAARLAHIH